MEPSKDRQQSDRMLLADYFDELLERRGGWITNKAAKKENVGRSLERAKRCLDILARHWPDGES